MGWGGFLDKLLEILPIQGRKERWMNELENLKKEKKALLKGEANDKTVKRIVAVDKRIAYLNQLLRNK